MVILSLLTSFGALSRYTPSYAFEGHRRPDPHPAKVHGEPVQTHGCWFILLHGLYNVNGLCPKVSSRALSSCSVFPKTIKNQLLAHLDMFSYLNALFFSRSI